MYRHLRLTLFILVLISIFVSMGIMSAQPPVSSPYLRSVTLPVYESAVAARVIER